MSLKRQAAHGFKWQALELVGRHVISLVLFSVLARLLSPDDFGLAALVTAFIAIANLLVDLGIGTALLQRRDLEEGHTNVAFLINVVSASIICVITVLLSPKIAEFYNEPRLASLIRVGILSLLINAVASVPATLFTRNMDFRKPMLRTFLANVIGGCTGIGMALTGFGVWSLIGHQLMTVIVGAIFLWVASDWRPSLKVSMKHFRELFEYSSGAFLGLCLYSFSLRIDQFIIGRFLGTSILGEYAVGVKLTDLASAALQAPIRSISLPALSQLQGDNERMCNVIYKAMEINALITFAAFVGLASISNDLVAVMFAGNWDAAGPICALLSLNTLVGSLKALFWPALLASGDKSGHVFLHGLSLIGVLVACFVGVNYGIISVVIGLLLVNLLICIPCFYLLYKKIGLSPITYCQQCLMPAISSIVMWAAVWAVRSYVIRGPATPVGLVIQVLVGAAVYLGCMKVLAPESLKRTLDLVGHAFGPRKQASSSAGATATVQTTET